MHELVVVGRVLDDLLAARAPPARLQRGPACRVAVRLTAAGPRITVGLRDESGPGTTIALFEEGAAPFGAVSPAAAPP